MKARNRATAGKALFALALAVLPSLATPALADDALTLKLDYMADVAGVVRGGTAHKARVLDNLKLSADVDLERVLGWSGATLHVSALNNAGATPNDDAGTLQGVDNIEVAQQRARLFEAFVEQTFAGDKGSALVGLYDVNSEFYANESAGLLIAPAFGIGSELAATGPNGPSIFPSTALAARLRWTNANGGYVQGAVINAHAGVPGDPGGTDVSFDDGVLAIGEAGWTGAGKLAFGAWSYSKRQDDWRDVTAAGDPVKRRAYGAYALVERRISGGEDDPGRITAFAARRRLGWRHQSLPRRLASRDPDRAAGRQPSGQPSLVRDQPGLHLASPARQRLGRGPGHRPHRDGAGSHLRRQLWSRDAATRPAICDPALRRSRRP